MLNEEELKNNNFPFIRESDIISPMTNSHSGDTVVKIFRGKNVYLAKFIKNNETEETIFYKYNFLVNNRINTPPLVHFEKSADGVYSCYYYEFLTCDDIDKFINRIDKNQIGRKAGNILVKLKNAPVPKSFKEFDSVNYHNLYIERINFVKENCKKELDLLNLDIDRLKEFFIEKFKSFSGLKQKIVHCDLSLKNLLIDKNNKVWLIDIETIELGYDAFNFTHHIHMISQPGIAPYYHAMFKKLFPKKIPQYFHENLKYISIVSLIHMLYHRKKAGKELCPRITDFAKNIIPSIYKSKNFPLIEKFK